MGDISPQSQRKGNVIVGVLAIAFIIFVLVYNFGCCGWDRPTHIPQDPPATRPVITPEAPMIKTVPAPAPKRWRSRPALA